MFFTDCPVPASPRPNVEFKTMSLQAMFELFSRKLALPCLTVCRPYKICDFRPAFGLIFEDYLQGYDYWAHGDLDVIYGDLRGSLSDEVLDHDIVSMFRRFVSGHLAFFKNIESVNNLFRNIPDWEELLQDQKNHRVDESVFTRHLGVEYFNTPVRQRRWHGPPVGLESNFYFHESWNTPRFYLNNPFSIRRARWRGLKDNRLWRGQSKVPDVWYWNSGKLTNNVDDVELPYLHFMHWVREDWKCLNVLLHGELKELEQGFRVERGGFFPLGAPRLGVSQRTQLLLSYTRLRIKQRARRMMEGFSNRVSV
jgi:Family of unknown function (DUF6625)